MKLLVLLSIFVSMAALDPFGEHASPFEVALKATVASLAGAVVFMFIWFRSLFSKQEKKQEKLELVNAQHQGRIAVLERHTGLVQAVSKCGSDDCPLRESAQQILHPDYDA